MILEDSQRIKLKETLETLEHPLVIQASLKNDSQDKEMRIFLNELAQMSAKITLEETDLSRTPAFRIGQEGKEARVEFAGLPLGHEFDSFLMALCQVDGQLLEVSESIRSRFLKIDRKIHFETYVSLTCRKCPKIVQTLNYLAIVEPNISHTMIEGKQFYKERMSKNVFAVPTVFIDGKEVTNGAKTMEQLLDCALGINNIDDFLAKGIFDVLVIGGGPAGNSATIYAARKGLSVGMIAESYGGKVMDISGVENVIGIPYIEGPKLMNEIEIHVNQYSVDIMNNQRATAIHKRENLLEVTLENTAILKAKTVIFAVGVTWKKLYVPGEEELFTKGVTYCPHCDGPLFNGKNVAIIGGGNQAIEGALDLANKVSHVYVLDRASSFKADEVLIQRASKCPNITFVLEADVTEIYGHNRVEGLTYLNLKTQQQHSVQVEGIFIQIGLMPNTHWLTETEIKLNAKGEFVIDECGMTNLQGVFAAGDCTNARYKQIVLSMASGATAALGAFDYLIRQ
ncbi:alkyl hydroperoxide reductase subunit F [Enterococcus sp. AZ194]|uniref:alkyl hydroperoxide reductase subunit F n=1 Tax=Enterococcus sp. AZ194 TaxID=2774629 RepID=UPI003F2080C9